MKKRPGVLRQLLLVLGMASALAAGALPAADRPENLASVVQPFVNRQELAGAVMLVASRERVFDAEAVGYADLKTDRPMRTDSLFWIASQSKPMTATGLMMLAEEGRVKVDGLITIWMVQHAGFPGNGAQALGAFRQAAYQLFGAEAGAVR